MLTIKQYFYKKLDLTKQNTLKRRKFIQNASLSGMGIAAATVGISCSDKTEKPDPLPAEVNANKKLALFH